MVGMKAEAVLPAVPRGRYRASGGHVAFKAVLFMFVFPFFLALTEIAAGQEPDIPVPRREWEPVSEDKPRLAIVIDDWGYAWSAADAFLDFPAPLTLAVIPHLTFSDRHARQAREAGYDVLLHLPMEPWGGLSRVEPGAIAVSMSDEEIRETVRRGLETIPWAVGVNNHMGSTATEDPRVMAAVLEVIDEGGYFFLDSKTTPNSVVGEVAESMGVPFLNNQIFIDSDFDPDAMHARLLSIARTAERFGSAVAIGHVHPSTIEALYRALPELQQRGVELVHISALMPDVPKVQEFGLAPGIQHEAEQPDTADPHSSGVQEDGEQTLPRQLFRGPNRAAKYYGTRSVEGGMSSE